MRQKKKAKQLEFFNQPKIMKEFGGALLGRSNATRARPLTTSQAIHLTMRSSLARGSRSMLANSGRKLHIERKLRKLSAQFGVKIYRFANVGNHLHLLLRITNRNLFQNFLRSIAGIIARICLGAERGKSKGLKFWDQRPWTRIVPWGRAYGSIVKYVELNFFEGLGFKRIVAKVKVSSA